MKRKRDYQALDSLDTVYGYYIQMTLGKFLVRRILQGVFVIWGVITIMFGLRAVSPGDPANLMLAEERRRHSSSKSEKRRD